MDSNTDFDPFIDEVPVTQIDRLRSLQIRSKNLLRTRTDSQLRAACSTIEWLTSEYFYIQKERWIAFQVENGGSILRYLRYEDRTEDGLRELVDHHRGVDIDKGEFDFPTEEDTLPLEALLEGLRGFSLDDQDFPDAKVYEYVATLALVLIGGAVRSYQEEGWPQFLREDLPIMRLGMIANDAVDIMEVVCRAEQLKDQFESSERIRFLLHMNEKELPGRVEELARKKLSLSASLAASARHKETTESKLKAIECWVETGANFSSRAAFARTKHKEYGVTERTLYGWIAAHERSMV